MKIYIKNCGAVGEGTIDLSKRITLLCGENGTGKTYFSYIVYGLLQTRFHVKSDEKIVEKLISNVQKITCAEILRLRAFDEIVPSW